MAERHRSKDGSRDTDAFDIDVDVTDQQGRAGGGLQRQVGTRDELKRAERDIAGITRVRKGDRANPMDETNGSDTDNGDAA